MNHPYRALYVLDRPRTAPPDDGARIAYAVMTVVGVVPLVVPGVPVIQTAFGGACALIGACLLARSRATSAARASLPPGPRASPD